MPTPLLRRALVRPALLLPFLALACNPPPPPTTPEPPQVSVVVDQPNTVGKSLKLFITTTGCDQVQKLELLDNNELLKQVTYGATPTAVELATSDLRFTRGIATNLSLTARVTCADGRTNVSQAQPATYFPVEEVVEPINSTTPAVPDYFVADGSGANASFIGCTKEGSRSFLYKVPKSNPANRQSIEMDFPCDPTTIITDRKPAGTGWRWVWTKGMGAFAIDASFKVTARTTGLTVKNLTIGPDGKALIYDEVSLRALSPTGGEAWPPLIVGDPNGLTSLILADPYVRPDGRIAIPFYDEGFDQTVISVGTVRYSDGQDLKMYEVDTIKPIQQPPVAFDPTGKVLYLATQTTSPTIFATVRACGFEGGKCIPSGNRLWISSELPGYMAGLVPYNNGTRVAAIGSNRFWFLEARDGQLNEGQAVNKDQQPLIANGSLVARFAQPGAGDTFYMFTSAGWAEGDPPPYPVEIVATDAAERGELFRYRVPGGSLYGALDDSEALWLRVGSKLVKPFTPAQYRAMR
ncbi:hypothetical protein ATI61_11789 [Archangium gephyra]|uniref:Lipoprotein n=1 Tax=Archangium gephyra TaxID=48 RepID=A0AAC8TFM5_9BACT|nr:hypothetical protein [Archangium gephyra]AKJ02701.1 Hypothetical protein AA314_04327 [Archangium gephyra]REG23246.1 hypothetical protein ATI61_11789 [Archangium gephyra]